MSELKISRYVEPMPRVYGLESELGVIDIDNAFETEEELENSILKEISNVGNYIPGISQIGQYLSNGARLYEDVGEHVEYCTPECQTINELVASDIAGQEILTKLANELPGTRLNTRVIDYYNNTWGSHENYLVDRDTDPSLMPVKIPLGTFLATRGLLTGAGFIDTYENGRYSFKISQKTETLHKFTNDQSHNLFDRGPYDLYDSDPGRKPLIDLREEELADKVDYRRIHLTSGDPTMSPWATAVRFGATSLMLYLIEYGADFRELLVSEPLLVARQVSYDITHQKPIELISGKTARPAEIQLGLAELALELTQKVPLPEELAVIAQEWYIGAEHVLQDPSKLVGKSDWATKKAIMEKLPDVDLSHKDREKKVKQIDMAWGNLAAGGIALKLREKHFFEDPLGAQENAHKYIYQAPVGRAAVRGALIETLSSNEEVAKAVAIEWDSISFKDDPDTFELSDPYAGDPTMTKKLYKWVNKNIRQLQYKSRNSA